MPIKLQFKQLKNERLWLSIIFIVGLLFIFISLINKLSFPDTSYNFLGTTGKAKLDPGAPVTQVFTAKENNLNQIKVLLENSDMKFGEKIVFSLDDSSCNYTIAEKTYNFLDLSPFIYYRLRFPEIPDSAGRAYCLKITYFSPYDRGSDRPYIGASEGEQFTGWSYANSGNGRIYENRTLQMRPSYGTGSFWRDIERLADRLSQYKPVLLKGFVLEIISATFILGTLFLGTAIVKR